MSNCDCQENIKNPIEDECTVVTEEPIWDGLSITTVAVATIGIFLV